MFFTKKIVEPIEKVHEKFLEAVESVNNLKKTANVTMNHGLDLYGLYKQATEGDCIISRSRFNPVAQKKYDAWIKHEGTELNAAKAAYIKLVAALEPEYRIEKEESKVPILKLG